MLSIIIIIFELGIVFNSIILLCYIFYALCHLKTGIYASACAGVLISLDKFRGLDRLNVVVAILTLNFVMQLDGFMLFLWRNSGNKVIMRLKGSEISRI